MTDEIVFYHNPMSRSRIVHWMLEEVGAPYRIEPLSLDRGEHKRPEYLKLNPMGKIPTIVHRNTVITEAAAICAYLADAFPAAQLAPPIDDVRRGTYYRWLFFGAGCVEPALADKTFPRSASDARSLAWGCYEDTVDTLESALQPGPFILGDHFSAADVYIGSEIGWGLLVKSLEPRPSFAAYVGRLNERPAMQRMIEQNKSLAHEAAQ